MEHTLAISQVLVPILLGLLCALCSYGNYMVKRIIERNEADHEKFSAMDASHEQRITRVETKVDHMEADIVQLNGQIAGHTWRREA